MRVGSWFAYVVGIVRLLAGTSALAASEGIAPMGGSLDALIERFQATPEPAGDVRLDAWVEGAGKAREIVLVIEPQGETKLVADPGITVMPGERSEIRWLTPLPHRHVDPTRQYFDPLASVRLPFRGGNGVPIELQVEYAYCVIDFQCFFGQKTVTVENRID